MGVDQLRLDMPDMGTRCRILKGHAISILFLSTIKLN